MVNDPIGTGRNGEPVYLKDIWPSNEEIRSLIDQHVHSDMFRNRYADVYHGDERWRAIEVTGGDTYSWPPESTYIQNPPYFTGMTMTPNPPGDIERRARSGGVRGFDHHRPHLACRSDQAGQPGGPLSARARGQPRRVQQLRRAARQP